VRIGALLRGAVTGEACGGTRRAAGVGCVPVAGGRGAAAGFVAGLVVGCGRLAVLRDVEDAAVLGWAC